jgi:hypothetical protein
MSLFCLLLNALQHRLRRLLTLLTAFVAVVASGAIAAQTLQTSTYPGIAITTGNASGVQLSALSFPITVTTNGVIDVEFTTSPGHCSSMFIRFELDGNSVTPAYTSPTPLSANQSTGFISLGPVTPGTHTVAIRAEGVVGGCNAGTLVGWGGSAQVRTSQAAAATTTQVVPTMGFLGFALLSAALALAALLVRRRQSVRRG